MCAVRIDLIDVIYMDNNCVKTSNDILLGPNFNFKRFI